MEIASAFVTLAPSAKGFGTKLEREVGPDLDKSGKKLGSGFGKVFSAAAGVLAAAGIGSFLSDSIGEAREAQKVGALTASTIKSMGLESKVTTNQIGRMAAAISRKTAVDDEAIQSGQNLLLTFGNIASSAGELGGIFDQTTALAVDMSAALGQDMKSSAIQLGKALNDPIKGVSALSRVGVSFTEDQKALIKSLVDSGKIAKAQGVILDEVGKQFGGAAEAMATPADKARVAFGNLKEDIGTFLLPVVDRFATFVTNKAIPAVKNFGAGLRDELSPVVDKIGGFFEKLEPPFEAVVGFMRNNPRTVKTFGIALGVAAIGMGALTAATTGFSIALNSTGIPAVILAIAALAAGLVYAYDNSKDFRDLVDGLWRGLKDLYATVKDKVIPIVKDMALRFKEDVKPRLDEFVQTLKDDLKPALDDMIKALKDPAVQDLLKAIGKLVGGMILLNLTIYTKVLPVLAEFVLMFGTKVVNAISAGVRAFSRGVEGFGVMKRGLDGLIVNLRNFVVDGVEAFNNFADAARALPGKVKRALGIMLVDALNIGQQLVANMASGVVIAAQKLTDAAVGAVRRALDAAKGELIDRLPGVPEGAGKPNGRFAPSKFVPSSFDQGGITSARSGGAMAFTITNWKDGTGYFSAVADSRVESARDLELEKYRAGWGRG